MKSVILTIISLFICINCYASPGILRHPGGDFDIVVYMGQLPYGPGTAKIYTTEFNKIYTTQFSTSFYKYFNYISNTEFNNIKLVCTKEFPFEHTKTHQCVSNCNINEFQDNL